MWGRVPPHGVEPLSMGLSPTAVGLSPRSVGPSPLPLSFGGRGCPPGAPGPRPDLLLSPATARRCRRPSWAHLWGWSPPSAAASWGGCPSPSPGPTAAPSTAGRAWRPCPTSDPHRPPATSSSLLPRAGERLVGPGAAPRPPHGVLLPLSSHRGGTWGGGATCGARSCPITTSCPSAATAGGFGVGRGRLVGPGAAPLTEPPPPPSPAAP